MNPEIKCSSCGEIIPSYELLSEFSKIIEDEIECISCEIKFYDSSDIDNFGV